MTEPIREPLADGYLGRLLIPVCLAYLFLLVTVFGPFALWSANQADLDSTFSELLPELVSWMPGLMLIVVGVVAFFLPIRLTQPLAYIVFSIIIFVIIEFNFFRGESELIGNAGDGIQVDTTTALTRIVVFAVILALILLMRKGIHRLAIAILVCMALAGFVQIAVAIWNSQGSPLLSDQESSATSRYFDFFTFSEDNNIIHIVLDELQYSFFEEVVRAEFPDYENILDGFVYYRNHLGLYPNTHHSMFSLFQNTLFYNESPTSDWMSKIGSYSVFDDLVAQGVEVNLMTPLGLKELANSAGIDHNAIPVPYVDFSTISGGEGLMGSSALEAELLRGLTLKRLTPDPLHKAASSVDSEKDGGTKGGATSPAPAAKPGGRAYVVERQFAHAEILEDWAEHSRVGTNGTVYRHLHTLATHNPAVLKADCSTREKALSPNWENMRPQTTCVLRRLFQFFEKLKRIDAYDNSTIIVHADHGKRHAWRADAHLEEFVFGAAQEPPVYDFALSRVISSAMPILLVKKRDARHRLKVSNAPTSFADIAPTLRHLAGISLASDERTIFDIVDGEDRVRSFFYYHYPNRTDPYLDRLVEYRVNGQSWEPDSWSEVAVYLGPHSDFKTDRIDMGASEYRHHERDWWLQGTDSKDKSLTIAYTIGPFSELSVKFVDRENLTMTLSMKSMVPKQIVDVDLNGRTVGAITLEEGVGSYAEYAIDLPGEYLRESASELDVISFRPREQKTSWGLGQQRIRYGVGIDWIEFDVR